MTRPIMPNLVRVLLLVLDLDTIRDLVHIRLVLRKIAIIHPEHERNLGDRKTKIIPK